MKKVLYLFAVLFLLLKLNACSEIMTIDVSNFNQVVGLESTINYHEIFICKSSFWLEEKIEVTKEMVVSGGDTTTVGKKKLVINYQNQEFIVPYEVKYQVNFVIDSDVIDTQLVLDINELVFPTPPIKDGYVFKEWNPEIPNEVTSNLVFEAKYIGDLTSVPLLDSYEVVFGDTLSNIHLPENQYGKWEFIDPIDTEVGDVGYKEFAVSFNYFNNDIPSILNSVKIVVDKQTINFKKVSTEAIYDGTVQFPSYELETLTEEVEVIMEVINDEEIKNAKEYLIKLEIIDDCYQGNYTGIFTVIKREITINIDDYVMNYDESLLDINFDYEIDNLDSYSDLVVEVIKPEIKGVGDYEIDVKIENDDNYNITINRGTLKINPGKLVVEKPNIANNVTYGNLLGSVEFINDNPLGYWQWDNPNLLIEMEFMATVIFIPYDQNYQIERSEISLKADKRFLEIKILENEFVYDGEEKNLQYQIEDGSFDELVEVQISNQSDQQAINVGSYLQQITIVDDCYQGSISEYVYITKATPDVVFPIYDADYYEHDFDGENDYTTIGEAWFLEEKIDGNFVIETPVFGGNQNDYSSSGFGYQSAQDGIVSLCLAEFIPNDSNFNVVTGIVSIKLMPVAYNGIYYYGTIEKALNDAKTSSSDNGNIVKVIVGSNPVIKEDCEIKDGVTLLLEHTHNVSNSSVATTTLDGFEGEITNSLIIENDVTLINNGILEIGGILSGGGGGCAASGQTVSKWTQIILKADAEIISSGTINCYGYIKDLNEDHKGNVQIVSGSIYMPFILRDFMGGSNTFALYSALETYHASVFNQFEMRNVQTKMRINYSGSLYVWANLYAGSQQNQTDALIIGNSSSSLIQLTDEVYSYTESYYESTIEVIDLRIYGGAIINALNLKIKALATINVSTIEAFFPLSFRHKISLCQNPNQTDVAQYFTEQRFKIMPGAKLLVDEGVKLSAQTLIVYKEFDESDSKMSGHRYPNNLEPGELIVNGELEVNNLAGEVSTSDSSTAKLIIIDTVEINSYEPLAYKGSSIFCKITSWKTISEKLKLKMYDGVAVSNEYQLASIGTYYAQNGGWYLEK